MPKQQKNDPNLTDTAVDTENATNGGGTAAAKPKQRGGECKYASKVKPYLAEIARYARCGVTEGQLCEYYGVGKTQWAAYKKKYPELTEILYKARQELKTDLINKSYQVAMGYDYEEVTTVEEKTPSGQVVGIKTTTYKRHAKADAAMIQFLLIKHLFDSKYGIVATDYEADFTPVNISAADIPSNVLEFIRTDILAPFGVSLPIYTGKYTDAEYTAFYQTAVEGVLLSIAQAMKITLFTPRQLAYGHVIKYYDKLVQSLSFERRQQIAEMTKDDALLSRDERRELLGYEPDGEPTRVSLNYINVDIADNYQMQTVTKGVKPTAAPPDEGGGNNDE